MEMELLVSVAALVAMAIVVVALGRGVEIVPVAEGLGGEAWA